MSYATRPKPAQTKPAAFEDLDVPQVEEGTPQHVIFGDVWTTDWHVLGMGNFRTMELYNQWRTLVYWLGIHAGLCRGPINEIVQIKVGDRVAWQSGVSVPLTDAGAAQLPRNGLTLSQIDLSANDNATLFLDKFELFGGYSKEGGVVGACYIMMGADDQTLNTKLGTMLGGVQPAFRGVVTTFFDGIITCNSPYPKPWSYRLRRTTKGWQDDDPWYPALAKINMPVPDDINYVLDDTQSNNFGLFYELAAYADAEGVHVYAMDRSDVGGNPATVNHYVWPAGESPSLVNTFELEFDPFFQYQLNMSIPRGTSDVNLFVAHSADFDQFGDTDYYVYVINSFGVVLNKQRIYTVPAAQWNSATTVHYVIRNNTFYFCVMTYTQTLVGRFEIGSDDAPVIVDLGDLYEVYIAGIHQSKLYVVASVDATPANDVIYKVNLSSFAIEETLSVPDYGQLGAAGTSRYAIRFYDDAIYYYNSSAGKLFKRQTLDGADIDIGALPSGANASTPSSLDFQVFGSSSTFQVFWNNAWALNAAVYLMSWIGPDGPIHAMNPAHIIYEGLTNKDWGRGLDPALIDTTSFSSVADDLAAEYFGLCLRWTRQVQIKDFIEEIVATIGATLYPDTSTGLMSLYLIRDDYDVGALPAFDFNSGIVAIDEDASSDLTSSVNEIIVVYRDPISNEDREVRVQNLGLINGIGATKSETLNYPGIPTAQLALRVAQRELKARSIGPKQFKVVFDRRGSTLFPGQPFKISIAQKGISNMVLRVGRIDTKAFSDGRVTVEAAQDVFGLPATSYVAVQEPTWSPPETAAKPITTRQIYELPYRDLVELLSTADLAYVDDAGGFVASLAVKPTELSTYYGMQTRIGAAAFLEEGTGRFCPSAVTVNAVPLQEGNTTIAYISGQDLDLVELNTTALLNNEYCKVVSIDLDAGEVVLARGCLDTVPVAHDAGTRIWYNNSLANVGIDDTEYTAVDDVDVRLLTNTSLETLSPLMAAIDVLDLNNRQIRPYPPGQFRINGIGMTGQVTGPELAFTWAHRDRLTQGQSIVDASQGDIGPEAGTTYNFALLDSGEVELDSQSGSGTSFTYNAAATISDGYIQSLIVTLDSERDSYASWQAHNVAVERYGFGFQFGKSFGGVLPL